MVRSSSGVLKAFSFLDVEIVPLSALTDQNYDRLNLFLPSSSSKERTFALTYLMVDTVS